MSTLKELHQCACYLEILPGTTRYGPQLRIVATAVSNAPGSDLKACEESASGMWPNVGNSSMEGTVYACLVRLDNVLLRKWWKQDKLDLP